MSGARRAAAVGLAAIVIGTLVRVVALPLTGTSDVDAFKTWSYHAATHGVARVYGEGYPPRAHYLTFGDTRSMANYPPLAIGELALIGRAYRLTMRGGFPDTPRLTMMIKGAIVLVEGALIALLIVTVRREAGDRAAWWSAAALGLNPALIIASALGYLDVFFALPAVGALIAASRGWPAAAGALLMAGLMTKPQAVFVAPAVALALWNMGPRGRASARLRAALASASIAAAVLIAPIVVAGSTLNMLRAVGSIVRHDMLSGGACNVWWIVSYGIGAAAARHEGLHAALTAPVSIVPISQVAVGYLDARLVGIVFAGAVILWGLRVARQARDLALLAAVSAFVVHAYVVLSAQVHENHFFVAIPLLVLAAAVRPPFRPVLAALSIVFGLNLYLFYGFGGEGPPDLARALTIVDSTVLLSVVNCGALMWFAMTLRRVCASPGHEGGSAALKMV